MLGSLFDLVLPTECAGCTHPGPRWCGQCARLLGAPRRVWPTSAPGLDCWVLGEYRGPLRHAIIMAKERGRRDWAEPAGAALAAGIRTLAQTGLLPAAIPPLLVPAPTRSAAARRRGGDPVLRIAQAAARELPGCTVARLLRPAAGVRDSVGLGREERHTNLTGRVSARPYPGSPWPVVLVDDIITTGVTARASAYALNTVGMQVHAVLALAGA